MMPSTQEVPAREVPAPALFELLDLRQPLTKEVLTQLVTRHERTCNQLGAAFPASSWTAVSDDKGVLESRSRVLLVYEVTTLGDDAGATMLRQLRNTDVGGMDGEIDGLQEVHRYLASGVSTLRAEDRPSPEQAEGLRFVAMNCEPGSEAEFHDWYEQDHLPRFTSVPGVLQGGRYHAPHAPRQHLAIYWLTSADVVADPRWSQAARTDWTQQMRAKTFDRDRLTMARLRLEGR